MDGIPAESDGMLTSATGFGSMTTLAEVRRQDTVNLPEKYMLWSARLGEK